MLQKIELSAPEATSTLIRWPTSNLFDIQVIGISYLTISPGSNSLGSIKDLRNLALTMPSHMRIELPAWSRSVILTTQSVSLALDAA